MGSVSWHSYVVCVYAGMYTFLIHMQVFKFASVRETLNSMSVRVGGRVCCVWCRAQVVGEVNSFINYLSLSFVQPFVLHCPQVYLVKLPQEGKLVLLKAQEL